jgi:hypothetical protein
LFFFCFCGQKIKNFMIYEVRSELFSEFDNLSLLCNLNTFNLVSMHPTTQLNFFLNVLCGAWRLIMTKINSIWSSYNLIRYRLSATDINRSLRNQCHCSLRSRMCWNVIRWHIKLECSQLPSSVRIINNFRDVRINYVRHNVLN